MVRKVQFWLLRTTASNSLPCTKVRFIQTIRRTTMALNTSIQTSLFPTVPLEPIPPDHPLKRFVVIRRTIGVGDTNYFGITETMDGHYTYDLQGRDLVVCEGRIVLANFINAGEVEIQEGAAIIGTVQARSLINKGTLVGQFHNI